METQLLECQIPVFYRQNNSLVYEKISYLVRERAKLPFASPPTILPLPSDAPPEIPRLIMQTVDNIIKIQIAANRCDIFVSYQPSQVGFLIDDNVLNISKIIIKTLLEFGIEIIRIGFVVKYFIEANDPVTLIAESLTKIPKKNLSEITLRINKQGQIERFRINNIFQYDQGIRHIDNKKGVLLVRDINTIQDANFLFTGDETVDFISICQKKVNDEEPWGGLTNE